MVLAGTKNTAGWPATQQSDIGYIADLADELGIGDNVFVEMYTPDDMVKLYAIAEVCLFPSSTGEPFGLTMLGSLASGKPMITTNSGGISEVIQDGINGYIVPTRDHEALAIRIITLLGDENLRERIGSTGRRLTELRFTKEIVADNNIKVYKDVLDIN